MTSEETKHYIDQRLHELGLGLQLDDGGYEKIHRFTNGTESGLNQLCFKLVSLTSENGDHQVTTERVTKAIDELARIDEMMKRAGKSDVRQANDDLERTSIDQLAAVLEANAAMASAAAEAYVPPKPTARPGGRAGAKRVAERRPKILVVNEAQTTRALIVNALASDFDCIETADADDAWRRLVHQTDIALVITDVRAHDRAQYDLIGRIRSAAAPGHLIGIPIIAMAMTEDAHAKQRALVAGANDVIAMSTSAGELKTRVTARYKASRVAPQYGTPANKTVAAERPPERKNGAAQTVVPRAKPAAATLNPASLEGVRRPFLNSADATQRPPVRPRPLLGWLYQVSSTTTVTLSATVLVVVLLAVIMYVNRMPDSGSVASAPASTGKIAEAPRMPPPETESPSMSGASATEDASSSTTPKATAPTTPAPAQPPDATAGAGRAADDARARLEQEATRERERTAGVTTARPDVRTRQPQTESTPPAARSRAEPIPEPAPAPTPSSTPATASPETVARQAETDSAAVKPAPERLTRDDLSTLLKRFTFVYEAGDIEQFMNLFAANARTNDRMNRDGIRQDYESLFRTTDLRQFKLSHINWEVDSNEAHGWGNFEVTVRRAGDQELHSYSGSLTLYVERIDGRPRIVRLYHGQRRAGS